MIDYAASGVDLDRAAAAKKRIAAAARTTFGPQVLTDVGHFGGFFALGSEAEDTVLVASTDGVGTKVLLGMQLGRLTGLGRDLVQHSINDILMCGARPLFFLDYMAFGKLDPDVAATLAESFAAGCRDHGVALIGGETAEMPDVYEQGHFDLAGTIIGSVRRKGILDGTRVQEGDILLGLPSNGLHTNGYSLARKIFAPMVADGSIEHTRLSDGMSVADALMQPHRCYLPVLSPLLDHPALHALSHITGGGLEENTMRVIPRGLHLDVDWQSWARPELFRLMQERGGVPEVEMRRVFNNGIGVVAAVDAQGAAEFRKALEASGETVYTIGTVTA
jgi:phosphoribosylformylglycinamidine cyclo-ligase